MNTIDLMVENVRRETIDLEPLQFDFSTTADIHIPAFCTQMQCCQFLLLLV